MPIGGREQNKNEATQRKNARLIERFRRMQVDPAYPLTWRDMPIEHLDADHLRATIESVFAANRTVVKHLLVAIKKLLRVAIEVEKWIKPQDDPSLSIRVRIPRSTVNPAWPVPIRESSRRAIRSAPRRAPVTRSLSGSATDAAISPRWNGTIWSSRRSNCSTALWR